MALRAGVRPLVKGLVRRNSILTSTTNPGAYVLDPSSDVSQFSKAQLVNHGELEDGVIPEALKYTRPFHLTTLNNGLKVACEPSNSQLAHLSLVVKAGVRNEQFEYSGINHFTKKLRWRGTENRSKIQLAGDLENIGAWLHTSPGRETTTIHLTVPKEHLSKGVEILADVALCGKFNKNAVEEQREDSLSQLRDTSDHQKFILENSHYTAFRDHMFGQPIRGNHKSINNISSDSIKEFIDTHYVGSRMSLVGVGGVDPSVLSDLAEKHFGKVPKNAGEVSGEETPVFTPSTIQIRDDDVDMTHCGIFYLAPGWNHEDYFAFQLLQRIMGDYKPERDSKINHPHLQYNNLHKWLGEMEDFGGHNSYYCSYSDVGLFGHYAASLDMSAYLVPHSLLKATRKVTGLVMESEMYRARNKYYNQLLSPQSLGDLANEIGHQLTFANRRIPRSEVAKRISCLDNRHLEKTYAKWLWDTELAITFYGPIFTQIRMYEIWRGYTNDSNQI